MKKWTKSCLCVTAMMVAITLAAWCNLASLTIPSSPARTENTSSLPGAIQTCSASYIMITSPTSSSSWTAGSSYYIDWSSSGTSGYVIISYYHGGSSAYVIASDVSNSGSYYWSIPSSLVTGYYQIYISDYSNSSIYAYSKPFYVSGSPASITVTNPTSTSSWTAGSSYYIDWSSSGTSGYVYIEYYYGGTYYTIASDVYDSGYYDWTIPSSLSSGFYEIYIYDASNSAINGFSWQFYITSPASITVTNPTSSSSWTAGSSYYIDWSSSGTSGYLYIEYYYSGTYYTIASDVSDSGYYEWTIPYSISTGYYEIYIYDASNSNVNGASSSFYINNPYRSVPGFDVPFTVLGFLVGALGVIAIALKRHHFQA